jgi:hypothetical protein
MKQQPLWAGEVGEDPSFLSNLRYPSGDCVPRGWPLVHWLFFGLPYGFPNPEAGQLLGQQESLLPRSGGMLPQSGGMEYH